MEAASKALSDEASVFPQLTPHELRHPFGNILREKGADVSTIQKAMGHADISITAKTYLKNDVSVLGKAMLLD